MALADIVGKPEIAQKCLQQVLKIDPGNEIAHQKLLSIQQIFSATGGREPSNPLNKRLQSAAQPAVEADDPWQVKISHSTASGTGKASPPKPGQGKSAARREPKKSRRWLKISLVGVLALTAACVLCLVVFILKSSDLLSGETADKASATEENPVAVIFDNIRASNAESLPHYMATIHSKSPAYESTKEMSREAFSLFDLSYKISGVRIIKQTKNEVVVAFTLTTRKIRGPSFRDNRINGEMILRKDAGSWKIYDQVVHNVNYLN